VKRTEVIVNTFIFPRNCRLKKPINDSESDLDDIILKQNNVENNTNTQESQISDCRHKETIHKENTPLR